MRHTTGKVATLEGDKGEQVSLRPTTKIRETANYPRYRGDLLTLPAYQISTVISRSLVSTPRTHGALDLKKPYFAIRISSCAQSNSTGERESQKFSFMDFKFKGILLDEGRSGKTLLCEFRGDTIALKSVDLSKAPPYNATWDEFPNHVNVRWLVRD
ncbi:kinase-like domain-containing protein [Rhizophagus irregularis DAOM 181602=DAOM 197198]|nr:kinase-like domain-containing protein [Rhizophagus irregularis DAOM 181602=DAOM 197198]